MSTKAATQQGVPSGEVLDYFVHLSSDFTIRLRIPACSFASRTPSESVSKPSKADFMLVMCSLPVNMSLNLRNQNRHQYSVVVCVCTWCWLKLGREDTHFMYVIGTCGTTSRKSLNSFRSTLWSAFASRARKTAAGSSLLPGHHVRLIGTQIVASMVCAVTATHKVEAHRFFRFAAEIFRRTCDSRQ